MLGSRGEIGEDVIEGALAEGGVSVAPSTNECHLDAEFLGGPLEERLVEVGGGVCKGGENEDFSVRLAQFVGGGLGDFGGDEFLKFREFGIGLRGDILRGVEKDAELVLVGLEGFEPVVEIQMAQLKLELAADELRFLEFLVLTCVAEVEFKLV